MKTFEELKQQINSEFIKKLCEIAEGFKYSDSEHGTDIIFFNNKFVATWESISSTFLFTILLYRAVEGWNRTNQCHSAIDISWNYVVCNFDSEDIQLSYDIENYRICHLTQLEMAILDCLIKILK